MEDLGFRACCRVCGLSGLGFRRDLRCPVPRTGRTNLRVHIGSYITQEN